MKYLPLLLGIGCLLGVGYQFVRSARLLFTGKATSGVVVRNERHSIRSSALYPVVRFQLVGGLVREVVGPSGSYPPQYDPNETVVVHYDPAQPADAYIGGFFGLLADSLLGGGLGALFTWLGLIIVRGKLTDLAKKITV